MKTSDKMVSGFSKLSKGEKIGWLIKHFFQSDPMDTAREFASFWHTNVQAQKQFDGISENTVSNFYMPYGVAPNFLVNGKVYCIPMVIEESSVVAAASAGAKYWYSRGGFKAETVSTTKTGHVHFVWEGSDPVKMFSFFNDIKETLLLGVKHITENMEKRGGGIHDISLLHLPEIENGYYQLKADFETCDAMGANFINSVLEGFAGLLIEEAYRYADFDDHERSIQVVMSILSNYTPECIVRSWVECPVEEMGMFGNLGSADFAEKFRRAVHIACCDPYRATTHNKGIFNGIDAVIIATGNDFRAIEACGHTYACRDGVYRSLSKATIRNGIFRFELELPLAIGTVGGLTKIHPLARLSLEMLGNPSASELMQIVASVGLAQNFAALRSLVTTGIQKGHMKMHLNNILSHFDATQKERETAAVYFEEELVSFSSVRNFINSLRGPQLA